MKMNIGDLSHVGIIVDDCYKNAKLLSDLMGLDDAQLYTFEPQTIKINSKLINPFILKVAMLNFQNDVKIELIQPVSDGGFYSGYLKKCGNGIHHVCYKVTNLVEWRTKFMAEGAKIILDAVAEDPVRGRRELNYFKLPGLDHYYELVEYSTK